MKKTHLSRVVVAVSLLITGNSSAIIIEDVTLNFESGATWTGTISFYDGYEGMFDTDGLLSGGTYNFNHATTWTWWEGTGQQNPQDNNIDGYYNDWLMDGTEGGGYSIYIGLSWDAAASTLSGGINFVDVEDVYYDGIIDYNDAIVGYEIDEIGGASVPDGGSSAAMLGLSILGLGAARRKSKK